MLSFSMLELLVALGKTFEDWGQERESRAAWRSGEGVCHAMKMKVGSCVRVPDCLSFWPLPVFVIKLIGTRKQKR